MYFVDFVQKLANVCKWKKKEQLGSFRGPNTKQVVQRYS